MKTAPIAAALATVMMLVPAPAQAVPERVYEELDEIVSTISGLIGEAEREINGTISLLPLYIARDVFVCLRDGNEPSACAVAGVEELRDHPCFSSLPPPPECSLLGPYTKYAGVCPKEGPWHIGYGVDPNFGWAWAHVPGIYVDSSKGMPWRAVDGYVEVWYDLGGTQGCSLL